MSRGFIITWVIPDMVPGTLCEFVSFEAPEGGVPTEIREPKTAGADGTLQYTWTIGFDEPTGLVTWVIRCGDELLISRITVK